MAKPLSASPETSNGQTSAGLQRRSGLDQQSLDALLGALDPDREKAAALYAQLGERLRCLFEWNRFEQPEALADQTLDRLALRVSAGSSVGEPVREPVRFAAGIARMIMYETRRNEQRRKEAAEEFQQRTAASGAEDKERLSTHLEDCLGRMPEERRALIERYYSRDARNHIAARAALASELKISLNALRNRAGRIRTDLENCMKQKRQNEGSR